MESYPEIKQVYNICPNCKAGQYYRLRFKYPDEGHMLCTSCKNKKDEESAPSKWEMAKRIVSEECVFSPDQIAILQEMIEALRDGE